MKIVIKFFGKHRDITGIEKLEMNIETMITIGRLFEDLCEKFPRLKEVKEYTLCSLNKRNAPFTEMIHEGDEITFFPPVGGG